VEARYPQMREIRACGVEVADLKQAVRISVAAEVQALEAGHASGQVGERVEPDDRQLEKTREDEVE